MNSIEDRLTAAARAAADAVRSDSPPPLRLPTRAPLIRVPRVGLPRVGLRAPRLLAPLAAAAAMVAIVGTGVAVHDLAANGRTDGNSSAGGGAAAVPPFFVATVATHHSAKGVSFTSFAQVGKTATGKILATIRPPTPYNSFTEVSAAADDHTFVLEARKIPRPIDGVYRVSGVQTRLYLLRLRSGGRHTVLTALPVPVFRAGTTNFVHVALSPSGARLAVEIGPAGTHDTSLLRVYDLSDGSVRTWSLPSGNKVAFPPGSNSPQRPPAPRNASPSWDGSDRFLLALVYADHPARCKAGCVQKLDTSRPGGDLLAESSTVFRTTRIHKLVSWGSVLATPDGSRMLLSGLAGKRLGHGVLDFGTPVIYDIATSSGRILSHVAGRSGENLTPLFATAQAKLTILGLTQNNGTITASIVGGHAPVLLRLPSGTEQAAW